MATKEKTLLSAIVANPDADDPRLKYADWLDSNGQAPRAEFIRLQCHAAETQAKIDALYAKHGAEWEKPLKRLGVTKMKYHRGFPDDIYVEQSRHFIANHAAITELTPLRSVYLGLGGDQQLQDLAGLDIPGGIRSLTIGHTLPTKYGFGIEGVRHLLNASWMPGVRKLTLRSTHLGTEGAAVVASSPQLQELAELNIDDPIFNDYRDKSVSAVLAQGNLPSLKRLDLGLQVYGEFEIRELRKQLKSQEQIR
jgi:uncharacterized protein (TIGR02996 family)